MFNKEPKFGRRADTCNNPLDWFTPVSDIDSIENIPLNICTATRTHELYDPNESRGIVRQLNIAFPIYYNISTNPFTTYPHSWLHQQFSAILKDNVLLNERTLGQDGSYT